MNVGLTIRAIKSFHELNVFFIKPRILFALDAAELACSCQISSDDTRIAKLLSHSVTPCLFSAMK